MFKTVTRQKTIILWTCRNFSTTKVSNFKVAVCGGCGGIGAPLALLLKMNPLITELRLQDLVKHTLGVAKDVSHIEYPAKVTGHLGVEGMKTAFHGADVVAIPAGVPRKPGMTRDDLFGSNAIVVKTVAEAISQIAPHTMIVIITNPVNSVVPIACEVMQKAGKLDPKRVFGVSTLDNVRAATFVAEKLKISPRDVTVPVIGGHSGISIVPLFSRAQPKLNFTAEEYKVITTDVQEAGTRVVKAKVGAGSATLAMAYAGARFINSLLCAMKGEPNMVECCFVKTNIYPGVDYFAGPIVLGKSGVEKVCPVPSLSDLEKEQLAKAIPALKKNIQKGVDFVKTGGTGGGAPPAAGGAGGGGGDPCGGIYGGGGGSASTGTKPGGAGGGDPCAGISGGDGGSTGKKPSGGGSTGGAGGTVKC